MELTKETMRKLQKVAEESIEKQEQDAVDSDDYYCNGILYCGKCDTPKQKITQVFGGETKIPCSCKCEREAHDRIEQEKINAELHEARVDFYRRRAFDDEYLKGCTFDSDDSPESECSVVARKYVEQFPLMKERGKGLLLHGTVGTGKTFLAACIANALVEQEVRCYVTNFIRIVNRIQSSFDGRQEYIDSLNKYDLLVIDDLSAERDTEFVNEVVMNVIDSRYRSGKPLIVTTNLTGTQMRYETDISKQRIYSRLFEMCIPVEVKGTDRRKEKLKADYEEMKRLLGL